MAQDQGYLWYFGHGAGIDFNSGSPVPISDGQLNTEEGVYTISTIYGSNLCIGKVTGEAAYFTLPTPNAKFRVEAKDVFRDLGSVLFKNNSMGQTSSNWSFGDDFYLEDNSSMIYHSYGDLDTYTIQLFVENDIGCRDSTVQDFVVQSNN